MADGRENRFCKDCGVKEELFPRMGKCCRKNTDGAFSAYVKDCAHCHIATSLPYGPSLRTSTIFECDRLGYGRRVSE
jgi:hypothetical protein